MWNAIFNLVIVPHPGLSVAQQTGVARDYGMTGGRAVLPVRKAMLFYVLRRLGLLEDGRNKDQRVQHIVVEDQNLTEKALSEGQS